LDALSGTTTVPVVETPDPVSSLGSEPSVV
jgi:hypothetical protein